MKSSSMPPAVVTIAETCLCSTSQRNVPRRPEEMRLEVYPRKMVVLSDVSGSFHSLCGMLVFFLSFSIFVLRGEGRIERVFEEGSVNLPCCL